jgi:O-acetyl-ADP-ribose deacetylase (regulator of RNase III)
MLCTRFTGGSSIQAACHQFLQTQRSIDEGDTFVSEAGDLQAKYVIHVNSPVCDKRDSEEETLLKKTVGRVLMQASRKKARTIAIPAIGCGNSG